MQGRQELRIGKGVVEVSKSALKHVAGKLALIHDNITFFSPFYATSISWSLSQFLSKHVYVYIYHISDKVDDYLSSHSSVQPNTGS